MALAICVMSLWHRHCHCCYCCRHHHASPPSYRHGTGHPCDFVVNNVVVLAVNGQLMLVVVMVDVGWWPTVVIDAGGSGCQGMVMVEAQLWSWCCVALSLAIIS